MLADTLKARGVDSGLRPQEPVTLWMPSKHMGNLLVSLAAIRSLESALAENPCTLIIDDSYRDIMEAASLHSPVLYFPRKRIDRAGIVGKARLALNFIRDTRRLGAAMAIAIEGDKVSQKFIPVSDCRFSVGPDNRYCKYFNVRLPLDHGQRHVFYDYEAVARQLTGDVIEPGYATLQATGANAGKVQRLLAAELPRPEMPYVIVHPCATKDYKQWPAAFFATLTDYVNSRDVNVVVTGAGPFDRETVTRLESAIRQPVLSLHDRLTLGEFIALIQSAVFYIGNDTGPTHLAAACGIPVYAIFGPTDEHLWGPVGTNAHILRSAVPCEPECLRRRCAVNYRCMATLEPTSVIRQVEYLL